MRARIIVVGALAAATLTVAEAQTIGQYVVVCTAPCTAFDGTVQPAGTVLNRVLASAGVVVTDAAGNAAVVALQPDTGQALYTAGP